MSWTDPLFDWLIDHVAHTRKPDVIIGGEENPYLCRWHVIPRNKHFNIYLHQFIRSDDDRAMHDHPWVNMSILLSGSYDEVTPKGTFRRKAGHIYLRKPTALHRVALLPFRGDGIKRPDGTIFEAQVWTLFITGPNVRNWGFACPQGWVSWQKFTAKTSKYIVGQGCGG